MSNFKEHSKFIMNLLKEIAEKKSITQEDIAQKTGFTQSNISRMFAGKYSPKIDNVLALCNAIGVNIFIQDKDGDEILSKIINKKKQP